MIEAKGMFKTTLAVDDSGVTIRTDSGMGTAALGGVTERHIPFADITGRFFKAPTRLSNGRIELVTIDGKSIVNFKYGKGADIEPREAFDAIVAATSEAGTDTRGARFAVPNRVTTFQGISFDADTVTYQGVTQPLAGATAVVDTAGALSRRPTLTRVGVGGLLFGALGALGGGLLQKKDDSRQMFILIDGTKAAWAVEVDAKKPEPARQFAAEFNTAAKAATKPAAPPTPTAPGPAVGGIAAQLALLADLHAQGAISDDEYTQAKSAALQGN